MVSGVSIYEYDVPDNNSYDRRSCMGNPKDGMARKA